MSILSWIFRRTRLEKEMTEEFRAHRKNRADDLERTGLTRDEAERRARLEFGGEEKFREECREEAGAHRVEVLLQDLRFGARMLWKSPGFTSVAVLTLSLGIGATAAIFSVVYAALLRPLPYREPDRLLTLGETRSREQRVDPTQWNASYPDYQDWTRESKVFESLAGYVGDGFTLRGMGEPRSIFAGQTTINFFSTLGVAPFLGRDFAPEDENIKSGPNVAILTYQMWQSDFNADRGVIGRVIQLDDKMVSIIGVLPREFEFAPNGASQLWVPLHVGENTIMRRNLRWLRVIGRLRPGATAAQAATEMNAVNTRLAAAYPQQNGAIQLVIVSLRDRIVGNLQPLLLVLFAASGFVSLIPCANLPLLLLAPAAARRREFHIRAALGASRGRLVSQLLAESLLLASTGGACGLLLSRWILTLLIGAIPPVQIARMPFLSNLQTSAAALAFFSALVVTTSLAFGILPALQISQEAMGAGLKEETRGSAGQIRTRLRGAFVVAEIALCLVLLTGAGLMVRSLAALLGRDPGFDTHNLLAFSVNLQQTSYPKPGDVLRFNQSFGERVKGLPGIAGIASVSIRPLTGGGNSIRFLIDGRPMAVGEENECNIRTVSAGFFPLLKIGVVNGRNFNDTDDTGTAPQRVIVNQAWVDRYFSGESPLGKRVRFTFAPTQKFREIVGDIRTYADQGLDSESEPAIFVPFQQSISQGGGAFITYLVRSSDDAARAAGPIRSALHEQDADLTMIQPLTMDEIISRSPGVFLRRYPSYLIGGFAVLALILAMVGLYGLISYAVSQRTREIGIRVALGASRRDVIALILGQGTRLALLGVTIGVAAGLALTRLMRSMLFGVSEYDPATFFGVTVLLFVVSVAASYFPAARAVRVSPVEALRYE